MALGAIYHGIPEDLLMTLAEMKTAKEAWEALKVMFVGADRVKVARIQTLKAELEAMSMKETKSVDDFTGKVINTVSTLRTLGEKVQESQVMKKLLRVVSSKFLQIASTLEQFGDLESMSVEEVIGRLKAYEERMKRTGESDDRKLLLTHKEWSDRNKKKSESDSKQRSNRCGFGASRGGRGRGRGRNRGGRGGRGGTHHQKESNSGALSSHDKSDIQCYNCKKNLSPQLRTHGNLKKSSCTWYLDTGASNQMTGDKTKFRSLNESIHGFVKFGNESKVRIEGKGSIVFKFKDGGRRKLNDVYYIPDLCSNIISLGQLAEGGDEIKIKDPFIWVHDSIGELLMKVRRSANKLYKIELEEDTAVCFVAEVDDPTRLWLKHLGHINFN
ncbi:uncharacterized protein LOC111916312 [Lactuca sativa]|uniref:uncharacterized protein LOC111916312 n=1 Tax=Lactuca sativa TaxID=4236 RepID=UPI000CD8F6AE|nr:uncharacterized protein LOC111916312 [Lactuca sativa]